MKFYLDDKSFIETDEPLDISIPIVTGDENLRAWYVDPPRMEPVRANGFVGAVEEGGAVNFRNIFFNPHGHGTHTECLGHIIKEVYSVNEVLTKFICKAQVVTIEPKSIDNQEYNERDLIITKELLDQIEWDETIEALIIRTVPNDEQKKHKDYSASNPPYLSIDCLETIDRLGIKHLLIDLPSVDRESDEGVLAFHHGFWKVPHQPDHQRTITELVFVKNSIMDGVYILELQMAPFENDASPSRPVLYKIEKV